MKRLRKVAQGNYFNAEEIRDKNMRILEKNPNDYDKCVSFDFKGVSNRMVSHKRHYVK